MDKFGLLIWSYNRAAQLDLLLQSINKFCPSQFDIFVLYKSTEDFEQGYNLLREYHKKVEFVKETDFNVQTKQILSIKDYFAVSTDDTVIYKPFTLTFSMMQGVDVFSLRYGLNTIVQDPFNKTWQPTLTKFSDEGKTICWDSRLYHPLCNYGFIFGHDMHLYSKKYREIIEDSEFRKTNELESWLFNNGKERINPYIRSFKESVAVNIPSNNTSNITQTDNSLPLEDVNKKFVNGKRFRLKEIENLKVIGCHQLVDLFME